MRLSIRREAAEETSSFTGKSLEEKKKFQTIFFYEFFFSCRRRKFSLCFEILYNRMRMIKQTFSFVNIFFLLASILLLLLASHFLLLILLPCCFSQSCWCFSFCHRCHFVSDEREKSLRRRSLKFVKEKRPVGSLWMMNSI